MYNRINEVEDITLNAIDQKADLTYTCTPGICNALILYLKNYKYLLARESMKQIKDLNGIVFKDGGMTVITLLINLFSSFLSELKEGNSLITGKPFPKKEEEQEGIKLDV